MRRVGARTADEGVEALQPVHQPLFDQEIQGAIDRRRSRGVAFLLQGIEEGIGPDRLVAAPYQFQNAPAQGGEPRPMPLTALLSQVEGAADAIGVIVGRRWKRRVGHWPEPFAA